tara:strand:+ start:446 stop:613 length:168 start_codon:yes stop_codon:yes gene_type:complete
MLGIIELLGKLSTDVLAPSDLQTRDKNLCRGIPLSQSRYSLPFLVRGSEGILRDK